LEIFETILKNILKHSLHHFYNPNKGGVASAAVWGGNPIAAGDSIELGEHVQLLINPTFIVGIDYK